VERMGSLCLALLLWSGLACGTAAAGINVENPVAASLEARAQFAIADFDGDVRPDLASIHAELNSSGDTNYWIQLQLSSVGRQSIHLVAPAGGLSIEARDVNGDHAIDLVLATAWFREPVAIFLNDGRGGFSRVEPTAFPGAFAPSCTDWAATSNRLLDAFGLPPESRTGICPQARDPLSCRSSTTSISFSRATFRINSFLVSHAGRAPPSEIFHS
jgi:hypothetical protein